MADDHRYDWLDNDAVERLLRGEPVDTCRNLKDQDDQARAERLAAALGSLAAPSEPAAEPLPGEEAAVAAFRAARAAAPAREVTRAAELTVVRPRGTRFGSPSRLRRPLRAGMVAVLAGCAFGGVAMAAGAGVLRFGPPEKEPRPSSSVTAAESGEDEPTEPGLTPRPSRNAPLDPGGSRDTASGDLGGDHGRTATPGGGTRTEDGDREGRKTGGPDGRPSTPPPSTEEERKRWVFTACRQYLAGETPDIDPDRLRRLERAAGGPAAVRRYCERILMNSGGGDTGGKNGGGKGNSGGNSGGEDGSGGGDGKGGDDDGDSAGGTGGSPPPPTSTPTPGSTETPDPTPEGTASPAGT
ncbi:hypothetical protein ACZ90_31360 [Streptomyces albus subsp. albus]|nr:hypothetical protein ACZ90_31360 [Streptomyces albus subsp. albus]